MRLVEASAGEPLEDPGFIHVEVAELDDSATGETIRYVPVAEIAKVSFGSVDGRPRRGAE